MGSRAIVVLLLLTFACAAPSDGIVAMRVQSTPLPTPTAEPTPSPTIEPTAAPTPAATPRSRPVARVTGSAPAPPPPPGPVAPLAAFTGLGSWIDVYDHGDDPATILPMVRGMAERGVRTLYLETARYDDEHPIRFPTAVGAAVDEAKRLGMHVVAWYPPDFANMERDLHHSIYAVNYTSPGGHRFDGFAPDIEYTAGVPDHDERNRRTLEYSRLLREAAGPAYPLVAIVIPPSSLKINPGRWRDFPWAEVAGYYDAFMPMNYWTGRSADPETARALTEENVNETRRLTGKPVHAIGGLADAADAEQVAAYVEAALRTGSIGGGLYDYRITREEAWPILRGLNQ